MKCRKLQDGDKTRKGDIHFATDLNSQKFLSLSCGSFHVRFLNNEIRNETILDPHFLENKNITLLARFKPTHAGWQAAKLLAKQLS